MTSNIAIKINVEWGSSFQKEEAETLLAVILSTWNQFFLHSHKKNKIDIVTVNLPEFAEIQRKYHSF